MIGRRMFPQEKEYAATSRNLRWLESVLFLFLALFVFWHHMSYFHGIVLLCWCLAFAFMGWTERALFEPIFVSITDRGIGVPGPGAMRWYAL